jgi:heme oxygenase
MILRFDLAYPEDYALFLNAHYSALRNLEADWRQEDHADFSRMTRCLQEDLDALGIAAAFVQPPTRSPLPISARLGIAYVIRGSRIGAGLLRRLVPSPLPASYLNFVPGLPWNQFLRQLATVSDDPSPETRSAVIQGARVTFEIFIGLLSRALAKPVEQDEASVSLPRRSTA